MQIVKAVIGSSALIALVAASPAIAQSRTEQLKGDFAFTDSSVCVSSPFGFTNLVPNGPSSVLTFSFTGVLTFNGDGTGSLSARGVFLGNPGSASATDSTADFTYNVAADRTLTLDQGPTTSAFVAGPNAGQESTISGVPTFVGHMSSDGKSIILGSFDPGIETVTPPGIGRICHRSRTGIRIDSVPASGGHGDN